MSPSVVAGVVLLVLFWAWIGVFFARVRPSIMNALGRRLRVKVEESTAFVDAGTYGIKGDHPSLPKTGVVLLADFAILFLGTVGVAALRVVDVAAMPPAASRATLALDVENTGRETLVGCIGGVDGYTARNGYLHGSSARFDLAVGERRPVLVDLEATKPPAGERAFRLKLECANERLAVADAVLRVR